MPWLTISSTRVLRTATSENSAATNNPFSAISTGKLTRPISVHQKSPPTVSCANKNDTPVDLPEEKNGAYRYYTDSQRPPGPSHNLLLYSDLRNYLRLWSHLQRHARRRCHRLHSANCDEDRLECWRLRRRVNQRGNEDVGFRIIHG